MRTTTTGVRTSGRPDRGAVARLALLPAAGGLLAWAGGGAPALPAPGGLAAWLASTPPDRVVTAVAADLGRLVLAWCLLTGTAAVLARLPGTLGDLSGRLALRLTPQVLHRCLAAAVGLSATATPAGVAWAASPAPAATVATTRTGGTAGWPGLDRPATPSGRTGTDRADPSTGRAVLDRPATPAGRTGPTGTRTGGQGRPAPSVLVRPGDSLWTIAEQHLAGPVSDRRVASAWPRWYRANRQRIGPDPDLLLPGTSLRPPTGPHEGENR